MILHVHVLRYDMWPSLMTTKHYSSATLRTLIMKSTDSCLTSLAKCWSTIPATEWISNSLCDMRSSANITKRNCWKSLITRKVTATEKEAIVWAGDVKARCSTLAAQTRLGSLMLGGMAALTRSKHCVKLDTHPCTLNLQWFDHSMHPSIVGSFIYWNSCTFYTKPRTWPELLNLRSQPASFMVQDLKVC